MPVIDASVAVKWFVEESDSEAARQLLNDHAHGDTALVAPDLLIYEVANVLLHHPSFHAAEIQRGIERLYELELELIAPTVDVITAAIALASSKRITFYDALYVQLARHLGLPFYTADRKLISQLREFSIIKHL